MIYRIVLIAGFLFSLIGLHYMIELGEDGSLRPSDPMALSAWGLAFVALWQAGRLEQSFGNAFRCMWTEGILGANHRRIAAMARLIDQRACRWEMSSGIIFSVSLTSFNVWWYFSAYDYQDINWSELGYYTLLFIMLAYLAGGRLGRSLAYGCFGQILKSDGFQLWLIPGHPDGAGGIRVYSSFLFLQAGLIAWLLLWLATWVVVLTVIYPQWRDSLYPNWLLPLIGLLFVTAFFFVTAVVLPLSAFSQLMRASKATIFARWTALLDGDELQEMHDRLIHPASFKDIKIGQEEIQSRIAKHRSVLELPTSPLIGRTLELYWLNACLPFITLFIDLIASRSVARASIIDAFGKSVVNLMK